MKKLLPAIAALTLVASAQHVPVLNPSRGMTPPAGASPYGNILFPGGLPVNQSHASRLGHSIGGRGYSGIGPGGPVGRQRTIVVPYAFPVYYGDYGYGNYGYPQQPQAGTNVTVVVPQQPAPNVIINNTYSPDSGRSGVQTYSNGDPTGAGMQVFEGPKRAEAAGSEAAKAPALPSDKPTRYLIALKDSTVRQAIGYWVEEATLHYVTPQGSINHVTLDQVDQEATEQLNSERKLDLDLRSKR